MLSLCMRNTPEVSNLKQVKTGFVTWCASRRSWVLFEKLSESCLQVMRVPVALPNHLALISL